jgi:hypothetical protein
MKHKIIQFRSQLVDEPLSHNTCTFVAVGMGVNYDAFDEVKTMVNRLNTGLRDSRVRHELSQTVSV